MVWARLGGYWVWFAIWVTMGNTSYGLSKLETVIFVAQGNTIVSCIYKRILLHHPHTQSN